MKRETPLALAFAFAWCQALTFAQPALAAQTTVPKTATTPELPAYVARPAGAAAHPGVLVLHGCEGYRPRYAAIADWLAAHGYVGVAIDSLTPAGVKNACSDPSGSRREADDALATLAWMRAQPFVDGGKLAVLGYSMGAIAALDIADPFRPAAPVPGLVAAVAYYPACRRRTAANALVPIQILDGDADDWTPSAPCQTLASALGGGGAPISITTYPGATHAFNVDAPDRTALGHKMHYDPSAAADAGAKTLEFLRKYLGPPAP
jgi:dienelactone hydrolase